jgi:transposase
MGYDVVLLPPHAVRPYVLRNKTDRTDAKALLEAYRNEEIQPVPVKSVEQHAIAALHRLRSAWMADRTARINTVRGILRELGLVIPTGARQVVPKVQECLHDHDTEIPGILKPTLAEACSEIRELERRIRSVERELTLFARSNDLVRRLCSVPGIGLLSATALVAFVGTIQRFDTGRHFASYLGITPREWSSGSRRTLGRISKRGDVYLRMLLIHGARAVLVSAKRIQHPDRLRAWALRVESRRGHNKAAVALANKIARIAWAVWQRQCDYSATPKAA